MPEGEPHGYTRSLSASLGLAQQNTVDKIPSSSALGSSIFPAASLEAGSRLAAHKAIGDVESPGCGMKDIKEAVCSVVRDEVSVMLQCMRGVLSTELDKHVDNVDKRLALVLKEMRLPQERKAPEHKDASGTVEYLASIARRLDDPIQRPGGTNLTTAARASPRLAGLERDTNSQTSRTAARGTGATVFEPKLDLTKTVPTLDLDSGDGLSKGSSPDTRDDEANLQRLAKTLISGVDTKLEQIIHILQRSPRRIKPSINTDVEQDPMDVLGLIPAKRPSSSPSRASVRRAVSKDMRDFFPGPLREVDIFAMVTEAKVKPRTTTYSTEEPLHDQPQIFGHDAYLLVNVGSIILVLTNAIFLGLAETLDLRAAFAGNTAPSWPWYISLCIAIAFTFELFLRVYLFRGRFYNGAEKWWNLFDTCLIILSWLELLLTEAGLGAGRLLRALRLLRVLRVCQQAEGFRSLRIMVSMLTECLPLLVWATGFIGMVAYMLSLFFMQGVAAHVVSSDPVDTAWLEMANTYCADLFSAMLTLLATATGGVEWKHVVEMFQVMGGMYVFALLVFVIVFHGFLGVVTSILVLSASEALEHDNALSLEAQLNSQTSAVVQLKQILSSDGSPGLTFEGLKVGMTQAPVLKCLSKLGVGVPEAKSVFYMLDVEGTGEVDIEEFAIALLRLKGPIRNMDIVTLIYAISRINFRLDTFMVSSGEALEAIVSSERSAWQSAPASLRRPDS